MKLSRIPGIEPTVKQYFSLKQSTLDLLNEYHEIYSQQAGVQVNFRDLVEQILLDFMAEDKSFQKLRKETKILANKKSARTEPVKVPAEATTSSPAAASSQSITSTTIQSGSVAAPASPVPTTTSSSSLDRLKGI